MSFPLLTFFLANTSHKASPDPKPGETDCTWWEELQGHIGKDVKTGRGEEVGPFFFCNQSTTDIHNTSETLQSSESSCAVSNGLKTPGGTSTREMFLWILTQWEEEWEEHWVGMSPGHWSGPARMLASGCFQGCGFGTLNEGRILLENWKIGQSRILWARSRWGVQALI